MEDLKFKDVQEGLMVTHKKHGGKYEVVGFEKNSRTLINLIDKDRGAGWCEQTRKYKGVKVANGWYRGNNETYGQPHQFHIKDLMILKD